MSTPAVHRYSRSRRRPRSSIAAYPVWTVHVLALLLAATAAFASGAPLFAPTRQACRWRACVRVAAGGGEGAHRRASRGKAPRDGGDARRSPVGLRLRSPRRGARRVRAGPRIPVRVPRGGGLHETLHAATPSAPSQPRATERGAAASPPPEPPAPPSARPWIDATTVALALRLTCETNRRLQRGAAAAPELQGTARAESPLPRSRSVVPRPQQGMPAALRGASEGELSERRREEGGTVFHAAAPVEGAATSAPAAGVPSPEEDAGSRGRDASPPAHQRGVLHWGPDLHSFLDALLSALGGDAAQHRAAPASSGKPPVSPLEDEAQLILALTLLYLDRAASPETPPPHAVDPRTGRPWCPPCPYLVPRTVHRMVLTALAIAVKMVRGYEPRVATALVGAANAALGSPGVTPGELAQMEGWMLQALGGGGAGAHPGHVAQEDLATLLRTWGGTFYPARVAAQEHARRTQRERLWGGRREERPATGSLHGDGHTYGPPEGTAGDPRPSGHHGEWQRPEAWHPALDEGALPLPPPHYYEGSEPF